MRIPFRLDVAIFNKILWSISCRCWRSIRQLCVACRRSWSNILRNVWQETQSTSTLHTHLLLLLLRGSQSQSVACDAMRTQIMQCACECVEDANKTYCFSFACIERMNAKIPSNRSFSLSLSTALSLSHFLWIFYIIIIVHEFISGCAGSNSARRYVSSLNLNEHRPQPAQNIRINSCDT